MRVMLFAAAAALAVPLTVTPALPALAQQAVNPALAAVLAHSRRDTDRARDQYRHPGETLGLSVRADNLPALRLYRHQGFAPLLVLQAFQLPL